MYICYCPLRDLNWNKNIVFGNDYFIVKYNPSSGNRFGSEKNLLFLLGTTIEK
jgi:hypothetical protein